MKKMILALAVLFGLALAVEASHNRFNNGFGNGHNAGFRVSVGHGGFGNSFGHGHNFSFGNGHYQNFNRFAFSTHTYSFAPAAIVPTYSIPVAPVTYNLQAGPPVASGSCQATFSAGADPCAAAYGTYGECPAALGAGYTAYSGLLQGYGRTVIYRNSVGAHFGFNTRLNRFVALPSNRVGRLTVFAGFRR